MARLPDKSQYRIINDISKYQPQIVEREKKSLDNEQTTATHSNMDETTNMVLNIRSHKEIYTTLLHLYKILKSTIKQFMAEECTDRW